MVIAVGAPLLATAAPVAAAKAPLPFPLPVSCSGSILLQVTYKVEPGWTVLFTLSAQPALAAADEGTVGLLYYETASDGKLVAKVAISRDGDRTWSALVSGKPFDPGRRFGAAAPTAPRWVPTRISSPRRAAPRRP